jgi:hypothetical protein
MKFDTEVWVWDDCFLKVEDCPLTIGLSLNSLKIMRLINWDWWETLLKWEARKKKQVKNNKAAFNPRMELNETL